MFSSEITNSLFNKHLALIAGVKCKPSGKGYKCFNEDFRITRIPLAVSFTFEEDKIVSKVAKIKMQEHIIATNIQGHIGTLTNLYVDMETAIYNAMPNCFFTTVERELPIYEQIRRDLKSWGIPIKCEFGDFSAPGHVRLDGPAQHYRGRCRRDAA